MARPATKADLIAASNTYFDKLWQLIDSMSVEEQETLFLFEDRDKNIRDVLIHLYEWQQLLLNWIETNQKGEKKPFLPEPYNWKTYGVMNVEMIWKKHQNTEYNKSKELLKDSHNQVMKLLEIFTNEELFSKQYFSWTGNNNLGTYCVSATASHYNWGIKKIKKQLKLLKEQ